MFEDTAESPMVNRCGTHTFSRVQKSLVHPGFSEIDKKMKSHGCSADKFMQFRFDQILLFLKSADNSPTGRPEWGEKSFNILAGKTKPTDDDKDSIGLSLDSNYENLSEDEKREFRT